MISGGTWLANPASPNRSGLRQKDEIRSLPFLSHRWACGLVRIRIYGVIGFSSGFSRRSYSIGKRSSIFVLAGFFGYGEKRELGESEILKIPLIPLIQ